MFQSDAKLNIKVLDFLTFGFHKDAVTGWLFNEWHLLLYTIIKYLMIKFVNTIWTLYEAAIMASKNATNTVPGQVLQSKLSWWNSSVGCSSEVFWYWSLIYKQWTDSNQSFNAAGMSISY
jgi:hypothetical protein